MILEYKDFEYEVEEVKKGFAKIRQEKYDKNPDRYIFHIQVH